MVPQDCEVGEGGGGSKVIKLGVATKLGIATKFGNDFKQPTTPSTKNIRRGSGGYDHEERGLGVHRISMSDHKRPYRCKALHQQGGSLGRH
jgi:hypothetical protein